MVGRGVAVGRGVTGRRVGVGGTAVVATLLAAAVVVLATALTVVATAVAAEVAGAVVDEAVVALIRAEVAVTGLPSSHAVRITIKLKRKVVVTKIFCFFTVNKIPFNKPVVKNELLQLQYEISERLVSFIRKKSGNYRI
jgi:hypothetical protein